MGKNETDIETAEAIKDFPTLRALVLLPLIIALLGDVAGTNKALRLDI